MNSELWRVNGKDVSRGAINAVFVAVLAALGSITANGFDVFNADWFSIAHLIVNVGVTSFVTYIVSVFTTNSEGKIGGKF